MKIREIKGYCEFEGCEQIATRIARGRGTKGHELGCYCFTHANVVAAEHAPEYVAECPNCDCKFGVN